MTDTDHADDLYHLTSALTDEGWEEVDLTALLPTEPAIGESGILLLHSPERRVLLTATWQPTCTVTTLNARDPYNPDLSVWNVHAENLPVSVLLAAARAGTDPSEGPGPYRLLRHAGWTKSDAVRTGPGSHAVIVADPDAARTACATYLSGGEHVVSGPWLIGRDDLASSDGTRAFASASHTAPGRVIAALALTDSRQPSA